VLPPIDVPEVFLQASRHEPLSDRLSDERLHRASVVDQICALVAADGLLEESTVQILRVLEGGVERNDHVEGRQQLSEPETSIQCG